MREEIMKQDLITFKISNIGLHIEEDYDYEALYFDVKLKLNDNDYCFPLHVDLYDMGDCYHGYPLSHTMLHNIIYCMNHLDPVYHFLLQNRESICLKAVEEHNRIMVGCNKHLIEFQNMRIKSCQN